MRTQIGATRGRAIRAEIAKTVLRAVVGVVFVAHGWAKLVDMEAWTQMVASQGIPMSGVSAWLAALAELLGGIGLVIGAFTPLATAALGVVMLTAILTVHAGNGLLAANGGFEYPLVLLALMLYFFVTGAGPYSLDAAMKHLYGKHGETAAGVVARGREPPPGPPLPSES